MSVPKKSNSVNPFALIIKIQDFSSNNG